MYPNAPHRQHAAHYNFCAIETRERRGYAQLAGICGTCVRVSILTREQFFHGFCNSCFIVWNECLRVSAKHPHGAAGRLGPDVEGTPLGKGAYRKWAKEYWRQPISEKDWQSFSLESGTGVQSRARAV